MYQKIVEVNRLMRLVSDIYIYYVDRKSWLEVLIWLEYVLHIKNQQKVKISNSFNTDNIFYVLDVLNTIRNNLVHVFDDWCIFSFWIKGIEIISIDILSRVKNGHSK